jgi:hypothetical protein
MSRWAAGAAWEREGSSHLPTVSRTPARGRAWWSCGVVELGRGGAVAWWSWGVVELWRGGAGAWWSCGVVRAQSCGQSRVATALATRLGQKEGTARQRLRAWTDAVGAKRGRPRRREVAVDAGLAGGLGWVLSWWTAEERRLALDATTLGTRRTVRARCVVVRGRGIPVARVVVRAPPPGSGRPHGERRPRPMRSSGPADWTVIVLADRGLYAPGRCQALVARGGPPVSRLKGGHGSGRYRPGAGGPWRPLASLPLAPGDACRWPRATPGVARASVSARGRSPPPRGRAGRRATRWAGWC